MAGVSAVESVFEHSAPDAWRVTIVGDEPELPYDRTLLSRIGRPAATTGHPLHPPEWYAEHGAELRTGAEVSRIDPERRTVTTAAGERLEYDALVIATGSRPAVPPIAGLEREGVHFLRTVADARAIVAHARTAGYALVVGGGLLGLELARGLVEVGVPVTVAHLMDHLMETQLDEPAAWLLEKQLRHAGVEVLCGVDAVEVTGDHHATGLRFSTGAEIEGDLVAVAVGIDPNVELASSAGLDVARGIVVDDEGRTSAPRTWAVGECAEHRGVVHGVWAPLREQAQAAGASIAGRPAGFQGGVAATTLHVAGANLFTAGRHSMAGDDELTVADTRSGRYQKLVLSRGRVVGAILLGDVSRGARVRDLIARREGVSPELLVDLIDSSGTPAPMPGTIVCTCNRVSTEAIAAAARDGGLATVEEVAEATGAGSGCGACVGDVRAVLETA
jgi:ferredoxin-nitrate reductase